MYHHGTECPVCGHGVGYGHHMGGFGMMKCRGKGMKAMFKIMAWKIIKHSDEIGLSEEQIESLRNRKIEALKQMIQFKCQIKMNMLDVKNAVMREEIDMPTAESKIREIGKLKSDKYIAMIQAMQDMRNILTPEQRMKVKEMIMGWFKKGGMSESEGEEEEEDEEEEGEESEE
ncbi:MAG: Spy/CpxP family protein refolding chaperone [Armatimonadota bacterium]